MVYWRIIGSISKFLGRTPITNGGRNLNGSHSEDSFIDTTMSKKNSDGELSVSVVEILFIFFICSFFFTDEEEEQPKYMQLTNQHKTAVRAIRKVSNAHLIHNRLYTQIWVNCYTYRYLCAHYTSKLIAISNVGTFIFII